MMKATNEQLLDSYNRLKSVWKVASEFGMCGQSVWERLRKLGITDKDKWTPTQLEQLRQAYAGGKESPVYIDQLTKLLGKPKSSISRKAKELGLTSRIRRKSEAICKEMSKRSKAWLETHSHPRGAYKTGKEIRICPRCNKFFEVFPSSKQVYCNRRCGNNHSQVQGNQGYAKGGKREDLGGQYFRSRYEANYARYLNFIIQNDKSIARWEFEPETFEFKNIKRGTRFYTPDFKVYFSDGHIEYHEVKGWDFPKGRTARKRFAKYYPQLILILIDEDWFKAVKRQGIDRLIEGWESAYIKKRFGSPPRIELVLREDNGQNIK